MLKPQNFFLGLIILMFLSGCEPTINSQKITQNAQNLRENVRNIDTQRIVQSAQNVRENVQNIDTKKIVQSAQNLRENLQNIKPSSPLKTQEPKAVPESLENADPVLAEIIGTVLEEEPPSTSKPSPDADEYNGDRNRGAFAGSPPDEPTTVCTDDSTNPAVWTGLFGWNRWNCPLC